MDILLTRNNILATKRINLTIELTQHILFRGQKWQCKTLECVNVQYFTLPLTLNCYRTKQHWTDVLSLIWQASGVNNTLYHGQNVVLRAWAQILLQIVNF